MSSIPEPDYIQGLGQWRAGNGGIVTDWCDSKEDATAAYYALAGRGAEAGSPGRDLADLETYIEAARQHGEDSEPDHEVGDLQDMLRQVWKLLPASQRAASLSSAAFRDTLQMGYLSEYDEDEEEDLAPGA